jgi:(2Fe-2S) ferredoxin
MMPEKLKAARMKAAKLGMGRARYTLVICMDRKTAKCCSGEKMSEAWKELKRLSKELRKTGGPVLLRIKSSCFGVCKSGPLIGVFPDGVWYGRCQPKAIQRIVDEHLCQGNVVEDHCIAQPIPDTD